MAIKEQDINYLARLSRLRIEPKEKPAYAEKIEKILSIVDEMNAVDVTGVEPLSHPQDRILRLREDTVTVNDRRDDFMQLTPHNQDGLYLVPKVID